MQHTHHQRIPGHPPSRAADRNPGTRRLWSRGVPTAPDAPPLASLLGFALYPDRLVDADGRHLPFAGGRVTATCRTLFHTPGRAQALQLAVEGPGWDCAARFDPSLGAELQRFADAIQTTAARRSAAPSGFRTA